MKLHFVELENWRKYVNKLIEFDDRATVIYGPNETGKSTILEALHRGLFDRHSSSAQEIRRITPLTALGDIGSTVRIEYIVASETYRVEKTFNYNPSTRLHRLTEKGPVLVAQNDHADKLILDMLESEMQTKRASSPSNWGAFYWLWALQDKRELPRDGDVSALKLDQAGGKVLMTPKLEAVRQGFDSIFSEYYTPTGRHISRSPLTETKEKLDAQEIEKMGLNLKINTVEGYQRDLESKLGELPKMEEALEKSREKLGETIEESRDYVKIESNLRASEAIINEIKGKINEARDALERLRAIARKLEGLRSNETELRDLLIQVEAQVQRYEIQLNDLVEKIDKKTVEVGEIDDLLGDARAQYTIKANQDNIEAFETKITQIEKLEGRIRDLRLKEKQLFVTDEELLDLEQASVTFELNKQRLQESGLRLERTPGPTGTLSVKLDGEDLDASTHSGNAINEIKVYYEGLGEAYIRADIEKVQDIKQDIEILSNRIRDALKKNNVESVRELRRIFSENQRLLSEIESLSAMRKGVDDRSKDALQAELDLFLDKVRGYESVGRSVNALEKNPIEGDLSALVTQREEERKKADKDLALLRSQRDVQKESYDDKRNERAELNIKRNAINDQIKEALEEQQELIRRYGSEKIQEERFNADEVKLKEEQEKKKELERQYNEYREGPLTTIKRLEITIKNQEQMLQDRRASVEQLRGKIIENSLDGAYSRLSRVESKIEELHERITREQVKADSIMLLKEILEEQYNKNIEAVTEPIRRDVVSFLAYVTSNLHEEVELDDNLFPIRLGERGVKELALDYEDGSSGLKEVLGLCVRLALAKRLCALEPQCFVLDDPFVHVSTDRSEKMIELINRVIEETRLQVIILTHRPIEFAGFSGMMVDIQS